MQNKRLIQYFNNTINLYGSYTINLYGNIYITILEYTIEIKY